MTELETRTYGLAKGTPGLKSVGPITFGPDGILFIADNASATIFAIDVDASSDASFAAEPVEIANLDGRLAAYLGCPREDVHIRDLAVRPGGQQIYLSVLRGSGSSA